MALIKNKKQVYAYSQAFEAYLRRYGRVQDLPVRYTDLLRYQHKVNLYDKKGKDTFWSSVVYGPGETLELHEALRLCYAMLKAGGQEAMMRHLYVERIDLCEYGNTQPFRVKIVNRFNENFDYFYIKRPDANRLLGLELEHLLSPSRINYLVSGETIAEEHTPGVPGEVFIREHLTASYLDEVRLAKEFIKFNERCFVRLLGDMHANNFVVEIMADFEDTMFRLRSIDFDQQCYEPNRRVYQPQYYKENNPILQLGFGRMTPETTRQYQNEERAAMRYRMSTQRPQLDDLLSTVVDDEFAPQHNVIHLGQQLAQYYHKAEFEKPRTMAQLLRVSLRNLFT